MDWRHRSIKAQTRQSLNDTSRKEAEPPDQKGMNPNFKEITILAPAAFSAITSFVMLKDADGP
jgi:hypothetical protein